MTTNTIPAQPENSFRIKLELDYPESRMDSILLTALRNQTENDALKTISRAALKDLFGKSQIFIKGQRAKSSSGLAKGTTFVDILGY